MAIRETSFGTIELILERDGNIVSEVLTFIKEGRSHTHPTYETCYVLSGSGIIVNGNRKIKVAKGSVCSIPPNTKHWMIPDADVPLEILLVYSLEI